MGQFFKGSRHPSLVLALLLMTAGFAAAGEFTVNGRTEYKVKKSQLQAVQHLARATFGYTEADIDDLATRIRQIGHRRALAEWIDNQAGVPMSKHEGEFPATSPSSPASTVLEMMSQDGWTTPYGNESRPSGAFNRTDYREFAFWHAALNAPDQLRQRMAFALMQIVVINDDANIFNSNAADNSRDSSGNNRPRYTGIVHYYDMLIENAFGNYRTVLGDVTYHPVMGNFLTHIDNQKPSADGLLLPDENYAREILQLFSMGQFRTDIGGEFVRDRAGNLIRNYTNEDIKALARVFTGLRYAQIDNNTSVNLHDPMAVRSNNVSWHDFNEKVFPNLRFTLPARSQTVADAHAEIDDVVDRIFAHPNVGPYIARILIQRFVKANPSTTYIRDVATVFNDNGQGQRGDLLAVIKAILLHAEALRSQSYQRIRQGRSIAGLRVRTKGTEHSKLVEPIVRYSQFIKMFGGQPINTSQGIRIRPDRRDLSQLPYQAPSVFNYFRPDYAPPGYQNYNTSRRIPNGELFSPEAQIYTPVFANRYQTLLYRHMHENYSSSGGYNRITFLNQIGIEEGLAQSGMDIDDFSELLERLDLLVCHGSLSEASKAAINSALVEGHTTGNNNNASELARLAIFGVLGTPEAAIDE